MGDVAESITHWTGRGERIKPYSTLFGALKVADEVEVVLDAGPLAT